MKITDIKTHLIFNPSSKPFQDATMFPPDPNKTGRHCVFIEIETDKGHDSFLLDEPELDLTISGFLDSNFTKLQEK